MIMTVLMRVIMIAALAMRVVVLMFHRVRIPLMFESLHAPQPREKNARP